jgi:hypothetical protein
MNVEEATATAELFSRWGLRKGIYELYTNSKTEIDSNRNRQ